MSRTNLKYISSENSVRSNKVKLCTQELESESYSKCRFCEMCNIYFPSIQEASFCLKTHGMVRCFGCFKIIENNPISLIDHYRMVHYDSEFPVLVRCPFCRLPQSQHENSLKKHVIQEHYLHLMYSKKTAVGNDNDLLMTTDAKPESAHLQKQTEYQLVSQNYILADNTPAMKFDVKVNIESYSSSSKRDRTQKPIEDNPIDLSVYKPHEALSIPKVNDKMCKSIPSKKGKMRDDTRISNQVTKKFTTKSSKVNLKLKSTIPDIEFPSEKRLKREPRRASLMAIVKLHEWTVKKTPKESLFQKVIVSKKYWREQMKMRKQLAEISNPASIINDF